MNAGRTREADAYEPFTLETLNNHGWLSCLKLFPDEHEIQSNSRNTRVNSRHGVNMKTNSTGLCHVAVCEPLAGVKHRFVWSASVLSTTRSGKYDC